MQPYFEGQGATIYHGDCLDVLRELPDCSVDSVVTDPPYGLEFMGKDWDAPWRGDVRQRDDSTFSQGDRRHGLVRHGMSAAYGGDSKAAMAAFGHWCELWAAEALRVLKPGGHLLAFGGTRTWHRLAVAIEDAGFEIRDSIAWMYGSGFPKSLDVSKAIDKRGGAVAGFQSFRDAVRAAMQRNGISRAELTKALGNHMLSHYLTAGSQPAVPNVKDYRIIRDTVGLGPDWDHLFAEEAERTQRIGPSYKVPNAKAVNPHFIAIADRREDQPTEIDYAPTAPATPDAARWQGWGTALKPAHEPVVVARKPLTGTVAANVLEHGTGALNIDGCRIGTDGGTAGATAGPSTGIYGNGLKGAFSRPVAGLGRWPANVVLDEDQAAALDKQSGQVASGGGANGKMGGVFGNGKPNPNRAASLYNDSGGASRFFYVAKAPARERPKVDGVAHPTVKPLTLMRWLCRLVTPPGGTVLEPFAGSGTTVEAALLEGFRVVAIEREPDYLPLIAARLERIGQEPDGQLTLDASA